MADLDLLINSDKYEDYKDKTNAAITKVNDIKEFLEPLTAGQVPRQVGTTDFEFEGVLVPTLKVGESAKEKVRIDIGDWDMEASGTITVPHGLTSGQWKTMNILGVVVRNDADTTYYNLTKLGSVVGTKGVVDGGWISFDSTNITLDRRATGTFDTATFNSTSYNRGFIDIEYIP